MAQCPRCKGLGECSLCTPMIVTLHETRNPVFVGMVRQHCYSLTKQHQLAPSHWHDFLVDIYRDLPHHIPSDSSIVNGIDMSVFEPTDQQIDAGLGGQVTERIREWFKTTCCMPLSTEIRFRVRIEGRKRFIALASIISAAYPEQSANWPRMYAANDNWKPFSPANDN